ncbi:hypothetical protein [Dictyobacter kobayashii]|uniref:Uncharacterized protein n=1 Tax=Dictyobacter kobayashii TaxID=2014872 RepID=A0A402AEL9_9CHLR|nr:hypothetical protein [Dictyobacter kobayashii]GCE17560.1 hypothetical protein KDK_13600 [Dictyobacter kobayashii]
MLEYLELAFDRFTHHKIVPSGSYLNPRTRAIHQLPAQGVLPEGDTWLRIDRSSTQTLANIATTINNLLGTSYTAASFYLQHPLTSTSNHP